MCDVFENSGRNIFNLKNISKLLHINLWNIIVWKVPVEESLLRVT